MDAFAIQRRLVELGYDPGPIDGLIGRRTRAAIAKFQAAHKLPIKYPGTVGPITLTALFPDSPPVTSATVPQLVALPWMDLALTKKGLNENTNRAELSKFLRSDGASVGDPSKIPWCGDFTETCLAVTLPSEPLPANPYLARNWATQFGVHTVPRFGAVGSFWRGSRSGYSGHVGFIVGAASGVFYLLGGNQSNSVSVAPISKARLLDARWPKTIQIPGKVRLPQMIGGKLSINEA